MKKGLPYGFKGKFREEAIKIVLITEFRSQFAHHISHECFAFVTNARCTLFLDIIKLKSCSQLCVSAYVTIAFIQHLHSKIADEFFRLEFMKTLSNCSTSINLDFDERLL
jgi:hypothetical protein